MASIAASDSRFLVIDPTPGTCIIFPSFIPHFVFPMPDNTPPKAQRLSIAFNFTTATQWWRTYAQVAQEFA